MGQKLRLTSVLNEVGFFLEILGSPEISELKNSIWETLGKTLGVLGEADRIFRLKLVKLFDPTTWGQTASAEFLSRQKEAVPVRVVLSVFLANSIVLF